MAINTYEATLIIKNARVYTMDQNDTVCSAVAICNNRIICVGTDEEVDKFAGEETREVLLGGQAVLPGFIDSHIHAGIEQVIQLFCLDLRMVVPSLDAYRDTILDYVKRNQSADTFFGVGFQYTAFGEGRPDKKMLDKICPDKPIYISDVSLHAIWTNTLGLKELGIDKTTAFPQGGIIGKDEFGELTGELSDCFSIMEIWTKKGITPDMYMEAFKALEKDCAQKGITSINSMGTLLSGKELWNTVQKHIDAGKMTLRVNFAEDFIPKQDADETIKLMKAAKQYSSDYMNVKTVKVFLDGTPEGKTAFILEPYQNNDANNPDYRGASLWGSIELNEAVRRFDAEGLQIHFHAIGDAAVKQAIDAIEYAFCCNGMRDARHTIAHICLIEDEDIDRMAELGIIGAVQPIWAYQDHIFSDLEIDAYGESRYEREYPFKKMCDKGVMIVGSADNPVSENNPLSGIQVSVTRSSPYGEERYDDSFIRAASQALSVDEAVKAYTINGAKEMFMEDRIGSLEPGKIADMLILNRDIFNIDKREIIDTKIIATIFDGSVIYDNGLDSLD